jgi:Asp-tRNA(Asn)/Glu-tRNA(Gln) amidotransferase A subunit family amidase
MRPRALALLETAGYSAATADARSALQQAVAKLAAAGIPILSRQNNAAVAAAEAAIADAVTLSRGINAWETRWPLNTYARDMERSKLSKAMQERLAEAEAMTQDDYRALLAKREEVRETYARLAKTCDACITLAAPGAAPVGIKSTGNPIFAVPSSLLGVPALSLPLLETENLPLGLQMLGFRDEDAALFAVAASVQGSDALGRN